MHLMLITRATFCYTSFNWIDNIINNKDNDHAMDGISNL